MIQNQSIQSENIQTGPITEVQGQSSGKASEAAHMMYLGFMRMIESMALSEDVGASLAEMSTTIYDTLVENGTKKVKELQEELEKLTFGMEHWDEYAAYIQWEKDLADAHARAEKYKNNSNMSAIIQYNRALADIAKLSGNPPALPEVSAEDQARYFDLLDKYKRKSAMRSYINGVSQQLSVQNTFVSNNKKIGDTLQEQVKGLVNDQSVYSGLVTNLLRIVQRQLQYGHR